MTPRHTNSISIGLFLFDYKRLLCIDWFWKPHQHDSWILFLFPSFFDRSMSLNFWNIIVVMILPLNWSIGNTNPIKSIVKSAFICMNILLNVSFGGKFQHSNKTWIFPLSFEYEKCEDKKDQFPFQTEKWFDCRPFQTKIRSHKIWNF